MSRFTPASGLAHPIAQTLFPKLLRRAPEPVFGRERWETPDGDFLDVDLAGPDGGDPRGVLVVLHGLEGSSRSHYVGGTIALARSRGYLSLALNYRGCSGEPNRLLRSYHSGETGDLAFVLARVVRTWPSLPVAIAGFSLGANVLARWFGEAGADLPEAVRGGVAVSCPYDLAACAAWLDRSTRSWIRAAFLPTLRAKALEKARRFPGALDERRIRNARTFLDIDEAYTSRAHGFADARDYWARASSGPVLSRIVRPTLFLSAIDDPLIPREAIPVRALRENRRLLLEAPPRGGHVGFVAGSARSPRYWAEERVVAFVEQVTGD